jgi:26S proteasome regulatory subunit T6
MDVDEKSSKGEGLRQYFITKIEELELIVAEKSQNLRRLQAQRNELNAKGNNFVCYTSVATC